MVTLDSWKAIRAQHKFCNENKVHEYAPNNGVCYRCGRNIYMGKFGFSVEQASSTHVTYCPYCNRSFCD